MLLEKSATRKMRNMEIVQHEQKSAGRKVQHAKGTTGEKCKTKKVKLKKCNIKIRQHKKSAT